MSQFLFFFQAEDGIRDGHVTGVQTCALPIYDHRSADLLDEGADVIRGLPHCALAGGEQLSSRLPGSCAHLPLGPPLGSLSDGRAVVEPEAPVEGIPATVRSEERRVGKECGSRWWLCAQ